MINAFRAWNSKMILENIIFNLFIFRIIKKIEGKLWLSNCEILFQLWYKIHILCINYILFFFNILSIFLIHWYRGTSLKIQNNPSNIVTLLKHFSYIAGITLHLFICAYGILLSRTTPTFHLYCRNIAEKHYRVLYYLNRRARALHVRTRTHYIFTVWIIN